MKVILTELGSAIVAIECEEVLYHNDEAGFLIIVGQRIHQVVTDSHEEFRAMDVLIGIDKAGKSTRKRTNPIFQKVTVSNSSAIVLEG